MKKVCILIFSLLTFNAVAEDKCFGVRAGQIAELKHNFQECSLNFPKGTDTDAVMISVTKDKIKCMQNVAYKVFDIFYKSTSDDKKKQFDDFVKMVTEQGHNLEQGSDIGKHWRTGSMYELSALTYAYISVYHLVKEYIHNMELECVDFSDDALEELKGV